MKECIAASARVINEARELPENDDIFHVYFYNAISRNFGPREDRCNEISYSEVFPHYSAERISETLKHCVGILDYAFPLGDAPRDDNNVQYSKISNAMKKEFPMFGVKTYQSVSLHGQYLAR